MKRGLNIILINFALLAALALATGLASGGWLFSSNELNKLQTSYSRSTPFICTLF